MKAKVLAGGLEALPISEIICDFSNDIKCIGSVNDRCNNCDKKVNFNLSQQSLPLTQPCTERLIIECNKVWQFFGYDIGGKRKGIKKAWTNCTDNNPEYAKEYGLKTRIALEPIAPISEKNHIADVSKLAYGHGNDNYGRDKSIIPSEPYHPMQNHIAGALTEMEKGKDEETHFADYQDGDKIYEEDDLIGAVIRYREDHPAEEKKSVAQIMVDNFIKEIPPLLWEVCNKAPDENDIVWAKEKIAEYNLTTKENHVKTPENRGIKSEDVISPAIKELLTHDKQNSSLWDGGYENYPDTNIWKFLRRFITKDQCNDGLNINIGIDDLYIFMNLFAKWQQSQSRQEISDFIIGMQKEYAAEIDLEMLSPKGVANNEIRIEVLNNVLKFLHNGK